MKLYGFPASPNTWKVRAVAAHLGVPLELAFVDLTKGGRERMATWRSTPAAARRRWWMAISSYGSRARSCNISRVEPGSLWPNDERIAGRDHPLAELAACPLERGRLRAAARSSGW